MAGWQEVHRWEWRSSTREPSLADSALSSYHHWDDHQDDHWHGGHHGDHCRDQDEEVEDEDHEDDDDCAQLYLRTVLSFNPPSPHSPNTLRESLKMSLVCIRAFLLLSLVLGAQSAPKSQREGSLSLFTYHEKAVLDGLLQRCMWSVCHISRGSDWHCCYKGLPWWDHLPIRCSFQLWWNVLNSLFSTELF